MTSQFSTQNSPLTIVTGASSNHFLPLQSLLWTIPHFEPRARVIAYDLGLTAEEHSFLVDTPPFSLKNFELRPFDFTLYPPHFSILENAGRMAFRPTTLALIAREMVGRRRPPGPSSRAVSGAPIFNRLTPSTILLWLDAGCQLRESLDAMRACIQAQGVYCPCAPGTIETCLHPAARAPLDVTADLLPTPIRDAGICGFDIANPKVMPLLDRWAAVALDKNCTAPEGSTRHTHRQDAVFAVLLNQAAKENNWLLEGKRLRGLAIKQDNLTLAETKFRIQGLSLGAPASRRLPSAPFPRP
jgi:hypothetical protein